VGSVVLTLGAEGAEAFHGDEELRVPAEQVQVVDTTGAGDVFCASFALALERGRAMETAARWACRCASFSVARKFCIPSIPRAADVPEESSVG
jgi:ribokinase